MDQQTVDLGKAIAKRAEYLNKEIKAGDTAGVALQAGKIIGFASRLIVPDEGFEPHPLALGDLARDQGRAVDQVLASLGLDPDKTHDHPAIWAAADPERRELLVMLGVFGFPGDAPFPADPHYTELIERYYHRRGSSWQPNQPDDDDTWHPWTAYLQSKGV